MKALVKKFPTVGLWMEDVAEPITGDNDVKIKIISGDDPITVSEIARKAGVEHYEAFVSLEGLNDKEVFECVNKYTIFGRVSPEQKAILVKLLK